MRSLPLLRSDKPDRYAQNRSKGQSLCDSPAHEQGFHTSAATCDVLVERGRRPYEERRPMKISNAVTVIRLRVNRAVEAVRVPAPAWEKGDLGYRFKRAISEIRK